MEKNVCFSAAEKKKEELEKLGFLIEISKEPMAIAVVTFIMQRAIENISVRTSVFVDTSASVDQTNSSFTLLMAPTKAGAIPVGIVIHDSQSEESYKKGFSLLKGIWENIKEPEIENFMSDDGASLRSALGSVWPEVRILLCLFHLPQAM